MGKPFSGHDEISLIRFSPARAGNRAVFLVETRDRKEVRQVRELFDAVGQIAEVVPVAHGTVMSYAVQTHGAPSLFGKIEWLLKTQFAFSIVERSFSDVTSRLVSSLCKDSDTQMVELPECEICASTDPFPTRVTFELLPGAEAIHLTYCARCSAANADEDPARHVRGLVARHESRFRIPDAIPVMVVPEMAEPSALWGGGKLAATG